MRHLPERTPDLAESGLRTRGRASLRGPAPRIVSAVITPSDRFRWRPEDEIVVRPLTEEEERAWADAQLERRARAAEAESRRSSAEEAPPPEAEQPA